MSWIYIPIFLAILLLIMLKQFLKIINNIKKISKEKYKWE